MAGFDGRISIGVAPDLKVVFFGILIRSCSRRRGAQCSSWRLKDGCLNRESLLCHGREIVWPCMMIQTQAGSAWCRWIGQVVWSCSIHRRKMFWRWTPSQQLEVSVFPGSKHLGFKDELSTIRELYAECPKSHGLARTDLERFPLPGAPLSTYHRQIFVRGTRKAWWCKIHLKTRAR
jgi:hypothetical protein